MHVVSVLLLVLFMFRGAATTDMHVVSVLLLVLFMLRGRQQLTCTLSVFVVGSVHV